MEKNWIHFEAMYSSAGAREVFERAIETLLRQVHKGTNLNVQQNEVSLGDGGIDVFVGNFGQDPIDVYQCKFFLHKLEDPQRQQIRNSFETAMSNKNCEVKSWTLCIPKVLNEKENIWWASWKAGQEKKHGLKNDFIFLLNGNALIDMMRKEKVYDVIFKNEDSEKLDDIRVLIEKWGEILTGITNKLGESKDICIRTERKNFCSWQFNVLYNGMSAFKVKVSVSILFVKLFVDNKKVSSITSLFKYKHCMYFDLPIGEINLSCIAKVYLNMLWGTISQVDIKIGQRSFEEFT